MSADPYFYLTLGTCCVIIHIMEVGMYDFEARRKKFDEDFERTKRNMKIAAIVNSVFGLGLVGFGIWVVVKILQFFGVV